MAPLIKGKGGTVKWDPGAFERTSTFAWRDGKLYQRWEHSCRLQVAWVEIKQLDPEVPVINNEEDG